MKDLQRVPDEEVATPKFQNLLKKIGGGMVGAMKKLPTTKYGLIQFVTEMLLLNMTVEDFIPTKPLAALRKLSDADVFGDGKDFTPVFWSRAGAGRGTIAQPPAAKIWKKK